MTFEDTITLHVNGEARRVPRGATVAEVLASLQAPREGVAVEVNGRIVPKARLAETVVADGDRLEVVTFVGGG